MSTYIIASKELSTVCEQQNTSVPRKHHAEYREQTGMGYN